ncbi:MAG: ATP synthase F1 subunit epsilon [Acetobacteraceae bacterium]|nr:ATP synthase F1 subunit epsilon [Acetobacteraceae bacterium]
MALQLEIVSPEKLLLSKAVEMVVIPAAEGEMGVMQSHAPMLLLLRGGVIGIVENGQVTERLFVAGGFAEITPERCTVMADEAIPVGEVSRIVGEQRLNEATAALEAVDKMDVDAINAVMDRIQSARAMVDAAGV